MFEISVKAHFSGAHRLNEYMGVCSRLHGHNWEIEVFLRGRRLDGTGMLCDFALVKTAVRAAIEQLDHRDLNELPAFARCNPTSENLARYLFGELAARLNSTRCRVQRVWVSESPGSAAAYWEK